MVPPKRAAEMPTGSVAMPADVRLVSVIAWRGLVVPRGTASKSSAVGEMRTSGVAFPLPAKWKANGWPFHEPDVDPTTRPALVGLNW